MECETTPPTPEDDRREFLKKCGKFAAVTPPVVTLLLSTSLHSGAIAQSGSGGRPGNGYGDKNHDHYGPARQVKKNVQPSGPNSGPPSQNKKYAESSGPNSGPPGQNNKKNK
jgi:hypothetical protein